MSDGQGLSKAIIFPCGRGKLQLLSTDRCDICLDDVIVTNHSARCQHGMPSNFMQIVLAHGNIVIYMKNYLVVVFDTFSCYLGQHTLVFTIE